MVGRSHEGFEQGTVGSAIALLPLRSQAHPLPFTEPIPSIGWLRVS